MKKIISTIILMVIIITCIMQVKVYGASMDLSICESEDLKTTLKIEGITNCDLTKYNQPNKKRVNVYIFRMNSCPNCANLYKYYVSRNLLANYGDKINIISFEIRENYNNLALLSVAKKTIEGQSSSSFYTPCVFIGNKVFSGDLVVENAEEKQKAMENAIMEQWNSEKPYDVIKEVCGTTVTVDRFPFTDVKTSNWYYNSIKYVYENQIILGKTNTLFKPNDKLTRGQLATIIWRMEKSPEVVIAKEFPDVKSTDYYYDAVRWTSANRIVNGYNTGKFGPNDNITREQLATVLYNYAKYKGKDLSKTINLSKYKDVSGIASYAINQVKWAIANKIITGKENGTRIDPRGNATRAEISTMIQRYCTTM